MHFLTIIRQKQYFAPNVSIVSNVKANHNRRYSWRRVSDSILQNILSQSLYVIHSDIVLYSQVHYYSDYKWAVSSEFVSSSIPSWQILTVHAQPFRGARDLAFCLKVPLDSLLVWASSEGSGGTARMHRLAWTFAARIGDKYQIRLTRPKCNPHHALMQILL